MPGTKSEKPLAEKSAATPANPCPICGKPAVFATRPFCSKRCADIDLHRWLGGAYAIPAATTANPEGEEEAKIRDTDKS
ncbi:MAG TPA: DNA gyrase inhibitor YacG [Methylocella sp.]|nr:DNA gyrase inhibitor YacG [Methylocella sp.]